MDDMNALERQLADVVQGAMRPPRPVDAAAIVRSVTSAAPTGRWPAITGRFRGDVFAPSEGGFSMFSALKFMAASVIVALFGGFLLAGILASQPGEEMAPAAVTASPEVERTYETAPTPPPESAPTPVAVPAIVSELGLEAKSAEPGVLLLRPAGGGKANKAVGLLPDIVGRDGSLWWYTEDVDDEDDEDGPGALTRFGERGSVPWKRNWAPYDGAGGHGDIQIAPDGTIWLALEKGVLSYDGTSWTVHHKIEKDEQWGGPAFGDVTDFDDEDGSVIAAMEVAPDGAVWVARLDGGLDEVEILRFDDGWRTLGTFEARVGTYGDYESDFTAAFVGLTSGEEGVWLATSDPLRLRRYHDGAWEEVALPADLDPMTDEGRVISNILGMRAGPDGTLWLHTRRPGGYGVLGLDYYDGADWSGWHFEEGSEQEPSWTPDVFAGVGALAPDGGLWLRDNESWGQCSGLSRVLGTQRTHHFLADRCVHRIVVMPDGDVLLTAGKKENEASVTTKLFLITSEAVAAPE